MALAAAIAVGLFVWPAKSALATTITVFVANFDFTSSVGGAHFDPTINVGDDIHWVWSSDLHSTTSAAGQLESWDSGVHNESFSFDHVFTETGTCNYYCTVHGADLGGGNVGGMSGHVTVVPEPATLGLPMAGLAILGLLRGSPNRF